MSDIEIVDLDCTPVDSNEQIPETILPDVPSSNFCSVNANSVENGEIQVIKLNSDIPVVDIKDDPSVKSVKNDTNETKNKLATAQEKQANDNSEDDILIHLEGRASKTPKRKSQITDDDIRNLIVKCSACGKQVNHHCKESIKKHRHLGVLICKECYQFYSEGEFSEDDTGYNYCRWCAQGGKLYGCDFCPNTFCFECVHRNFGRGEARRIQDQKWKCYLCEPSVLKEKVQFCDVIIKYAEKLNDRKKRLTKLRQPAASSQITSDSEDDFRSAVPNKWLPFHINRVIFLCSKLQRRMLKLKRKHEKNEKSTKQIVAKFSELIDACTTEINGVQKVVQSRYNHYVQHKKKSPAEPKKSTENNGNYSDEVINISDDGVKPKEKLDDVTLNGITEDAIVEQVFSYKVSEVPSVTGDNFDVLSTEERGLNVGGAEKTVNGHVEKESTACKETTVSDAETEPNQSHDDETQRKDDGNCKDRALEGRTVAAQDLDNTLEKDGGDSSPVQSQSLLADCSPETQITCSSGGPSHNTDNVNCTQNSVDELLEKNKAAKEALLSEMLDSDSDDHMPVVPENDVHSISHQGDNVRSPKTKKPLENGKKYKGIKLKGPSSETKVEQCKNSSTGKVSASSFSSSCSSDSESDTRTKKTKSSKQHKNEISAGQSSLSKNSASFKTLVKYYADQFNDPKLLMELRIYLEKLTLTLENDSDLTKLKTADIEEGAVPDGTSGSEENFDETFRRLSSLPKRKKKNMSSSGSDQQGTTTKKSTRKKTKKANADELDDSCSEPFTFSSSSGGEESKKMNPTNKSLDLISMLDKNELAKASLLDSKISSSDSSDSDIQVSPKKIAKGKAARKNDESGSSSVNEIDSADDFRLPKKKGKYDKLLKAQITERNSDSGQKEKQTKKKEKKHSKRKVISSDEDGSRKSKDNKESSSSDSTGSDSGDSKAKRGGKNQDSKSKKRKRIKVANSSNSDTGKKSDDGIDGSQGKSRKNIRKIISRAEETKEAAQAEKERRKRVAERQKLYNQITETVGDRGEMITKKMVLEVDPESKEELVEIHPDVVEKLKPHQINGVKFMWECTIESVKQLKSSAGSGCILAHCMGLGKTLQVIAFLYTILVNKHTKEHFRTALVICPYNTVLNWAKEFEIWLDDAEDSINIFEMAGAKDNYTRKDILQFWQNDGGVLIIGYDIFRRLVHGKMTKTSKKLKEKVFSLLVDPGPDIVVCDEGHILKNISSAVSKATSKLRTQRRIVLTGTPLQNNLKEYHCMVHFVKPHLLGTAKEFNNRFVNPIINGQCADSSEYDVKKMKKRVHILHKLLQGCVQRCDYSALRSFLPDKHEFVISVKLSDVQIKMYSFFLERLAQGKENDRKVEGRQLFKDYNSLKNIWTDPYLVEKSYIRKRDAKFFADDDSEGSLADFIDDDSSSKSEESDEVKLLDDEVKVLEDGMPSTSKGKEDNSSGDEIINKWKTRSRGKHGEGGAFQDEVEIAPPEDKQWWDEFFSEDDKYKLELSGKMVLVFEILKECELIGDKVLLFSTNLLALDLLEELLEAEDEKFQIACQNEEENPTCQDYIGSWTLGLDYFRMDGSTNIENRKRWIDTFNDKDNDRARLFMISTKAGSLGTNLIGANRVIMLDASWNPSHDVQAIFRVYRFGQVKPVYIYRLLAQGTMEEKIYDRQVTKLSLQCRVIDEQNIERHFNASDLRELYKFDPEGQSNRPTPMVPKDRLLAELLIKHKNWIVTYHEHDSLLQNITEDDLTEEERQTAWQEYENEREGIITGNTFNAKAFEFDPNVEYELPDADKDVKRCVEYIKTQNPNAGPEQLLNKGIVAIGNLQRHYGELLNRIRNERLRLSQLEPIPEKMDNYIGALMTAIEKAKSYTNQLRQQYYQFCLQRSAQMKAQQQQQQQQWNAQQAQKQQQQWNAQRRQYGRANVGNNTFRGRAPVFSNVNVPSGPQNWQNNAQRFAPSQTVRIIQLSSTPGVGPSGSAGTSSATSKDSDPIITEVIDHTPTFDQEQSRPHTRSAAQSTVTITELD